MIATQRIYKSPHKILLIGFVCVLCAFLLVGSVSAAGIDTTALGWNPKLADYMDYKTHLPLDMERIDYKSPYTPEQIEAFESELSKYMTAYIALGNNNRGSNKGAPVGTPITDAIQLMLIDPTQNYYLANDIDCSNAIWSSIGTTSTPFIGMLDGQGYAIKNIRFNSANTAFSIFSSAGPGAHVKNLIIDDCFASSVNNQSGILFQIAYMPSGLGYDSIVIEDVIICNSQLIAKTGGSVIGYVVDCDNIILQHVLVNYSNILSETGFNLGGFIGSMYLDSNVQFIDCDVVDTLVSSGGYRIGGLVGYVLSNCSISIDKDCSVKKSEIYAGTRGGAGGLVGNVGGATACSIVINGNGNGNVLVEQCKITVDEGDSAGGLIGSCGDSILMINNIKMNENLISAPLGAGGLVGAVGKNTVTITNCLVENCVVYGLNVIGGLIGYSVSASNVAIDASTVIRCTVYAIEDYVGGILGKSEGSNYEITGCNVKFSSIKGVNGVCGVLGGVV